MVQVHPIKRWLEEAAPVADIGKRILSSTQQDEDLIECPKRAESLRLRLMSLLSESDLQKIEDDTVEHTDSVTVLVENLLSDIIDPSVSELDFEKWETSLSSHEDASEAVQLTAWIIAVSNLPDEERYAEIIDFIKLFISIFHAVRRNIGNLIGCED